jgi:hypothetical protein
MPFKLNLMRTPDLDSTGPRTGFPDILGLRRELPRTHALIDTLSEQRGVFREVLLTNSNCW